MSDVLSEGDLVLVRFDPAFGHEQAGTRPGLVISRDVYNASASFVVLCPLTSNPKPWPFKMPLPEGLPVRGHVLADQVKSLDRRRILRRLGRVDAAFLAHLGSLIDLVLLARDARSPSFP